MRRLVIAVTLLVTASFASDTLLTENFDATWRTNNPPLGWRIFHVGGAPMGRGDWDRTTARAPWTGHPTPYAGIWPQTPMDETPDSLISPIMDCRGYMDVTVLCSTNFVAGLPNMYTAQIRYSIDSGRTFPYVARDYYNVSTGTIGETLVLDQAENQAGVVVSWIFYGDLLNISSWYVDDVAITGEPRPFGLLFGESFNGTWRTDSPPFGWRIFHTGPAIGDDDWHREGAYTAPWTSHPTPFAAIHASLTPDAPPDSLISPTIDCSGFRNIRLRCSTYFYRWSNTPYTARLVYSLDGGVTFPYVLKDYYVTSAPGPVRETFWIDSAYNRPGLAFAWVFDGNLSYIQRWLLDDVQVIGETIPVWDVTTSDIVSPPWVMSPGPLTPVARFKNLGLTDQTNVTVACSLYDASMTGLAYWQTTIPTLPAGPGEYEATFAPPYNLPAGTYTARVWSRADSDYVRRNDTLTKNFIVTSTRWLYYDDGSVVSYDDWPVGHYGWGTRFDAGANPCYLESLQVFLRTPDDPAHCRYQLAVFQDSAGSPGQMYFKTPVLHAPTGASGWQTVSVSDTGMKMTMPTGKFFAFYFQVGEPPEAPSIGRDAARASGSNWLQWRNGSFRPDSSPGGDFMLRAVVSLDTAVVPGYDVRTLYVDQPLYEFVQRPFDAPIVTKALIENDGSTVATNVSVQLDVIGPGSVVHFTDVQTVASIDPGANSSITFAPWTPAAAEQCTLRVFTWFTGFQDSIPQNDEKRFTVDVLKGRHTGSSARNYAWIDSDTTGGPTFSWIDTTGCLALPSLDDEDRINVPTYFNFPYYDSVYNYVYVSANGWFGIGSSNPHGTGDSMPVILPSPLLPNTSVYPYWDNLAQGPRFGGGTVFYRTFGTQPNRYFVLIFSNVHRVGTDTSNAISFEAVIHENGMIQFQYLDVESGDPTFDYGRMAGIGLEDELGLDGLCYLYARPPMSAAVNDLANRLRPGRAINLFRIVRDAAALEIIRPYEFDFPGPIVPLAKIQNYGTVGDSIWVFMSITSAPPYVESTLVTGLLPGESLEVSFPVWYAQLGFYTAKCSVAMAGDTFPANDVVTKSISISPWMRRPDIPTDWRRRRVKNGAMAYAPTTGRLYALKGNNTRDFWFYDIATRTWDTLAWIPAEPSGSKPRDGTHLTYDGDHGVQGSLWAFKGGGRPDFYRYDIATNTWEIKKSAIVSYGGSRAYRPPKTGAALEYVPGIGAAGAVYAIPGNRTNYFWQYDIAADTWAYVHTVLSPHAWIDIPNGAQGVRCKYGSDLSFDPMQGRLFALKGSGTLECYVFDPYAQRWIDTLDQVSFLGPRYKTVKAGGSLTNLNGKLYALKGGNTQEFWKYNFAKDSWIQCTNIPLALIGRRVKVKRGSALAGVDSTIYCLKGSNSYEFWQYSPQSDTVSPAPERPGRDGVMASTVPEGPFMTLGPNPLARGFAVLNYQLPAACPARLIIYDVAGRVAAQRTLALGGRGSAGIDLGNLSAGVYLVRLDAGEFTVRQKLVVQR